MHSQRPRQFCIVGLCSVFLLGQGRCATQPLPPYGTSCTSQVIGGLTYTNCISVGTIGVVSAQYNPAVEFELPAKGWLGGAGRGAVGGTKAFIVLVPSGAVLAGASVGAAFGGRPDVGVVGVLWAVAAVLKGAGYLIVGPFYGAAAAEAPATVEEAEAHLKAALASMRIQETMRDHVVRAAQSLPKVDITVLDGQGPESSSDLLTYFPLHDTNIDSVLELRVIRMWLSSNESFFKPLTSIKPDPYEELQINPPLSLGMEIRGRLIRTADKVVLYDNTWQHEGESHVFTEWAAHDARLFAEEFERAYDVLADKVVTTMF